MDHSVLIRDIAPWVYGAQLGSAHVSMDMEISRIWDIGLIHDWRDILTSEGQGLGPGIPRSDHPDMRYLGPLGNGQFHSVHIYFGPSCP